MYKTIFLRENEKDIFQALKNQGIKTEVFEHRLAELFNRVYNNYVGYYLFKQDDVVYKMIVLPKIIEPSDSAEKKFVDYLLHYYRIKNIYKLDKERNIPKSLLQLAFKSNNSQENSHRLLEEFQSHKYKAILQEIESFFKRHKNSKRIRVDYISQSVKYKLNLKLNIKELDKTKIHQTQSKDVVFSMLATVAYSALKLFVSQKYSSEYGAELLREIKRVQNTLLKKYKIERGYKLSFSDLQSIKTTKLFSKTEETRQLLVDIKSLFGFEQMYKDNEIAINYRQDLTTTSFFINPSNFYEWYVYDILKKYADANNKTIQFDKQEGTATHYLLNQYQKSSNPDYILTDEERKTKIVIDAKWKNIDKFGDVKPSDYLKLKFDKFLLEKKGYSVSSYLVYPNVSIEKRSFNMIVDNNSIFNFDILQIDMEFEEYRLELDIGRLDSIEKNSHIEELKSIAKELSDKIAIYRSSILCELIEEDENEKRELLKIQLDKKLQELGLQLNEELEEQELLPEIAEILNLTPLSLNFHF